MRGHRALDLWPCTTQQRLHLERVAGLAPSVSEPSPLPNLPPIPSPLQMGVAPSPHPMDPHPSGPPPAQHSGSEWGAPLSPGGPAKHSPSSREVAGPALLAIPVQVLRPGPLPDPSHAGEPIKQIPIELGAFINALPPPQVCPTIVHPKDVKSLVNDWITSWAVRIGLSQPQASSCHMRIRRDARAWIPPSLITSADKPVTFKLMHAINCFRCFRPQSLIHQTTPGIVLMGAIQMDTVICRLWKAHV